MSTVVTIIHSNRFLILVICKRSQLKSSEILLIAHSGTQMQGKKCCATIVVNYLTRSAKLQLK